MKFMKRVNYFKYKVLEILLNVWEYTSRENLDFLNFHELGNVWELVYWVFPINFSITSSAQVPCNVPHIYSQKCISQYAISARYTCIQCS